MITTQKLGLSFGGQPLFEDVSIQFTPGNCYGLIGANGAGKSTFLKILMGDIEPSFGTVSIEDGRRIGVLRQDQFAFDDKQVLETVIMGHGPLYAIYDERNTLYSKPEMTDEEGLRVGELEMQFGEMDGYNAESDAATLLSELGIPDSYHEKQMNELESGEKVRVLLAQALFGDPDILLLDEPTNQLDYQTVLWLENFLQNFKNTVIVISHDRHFLNNVCTHTADIDYKQIKIYAGNYDFWKQSSELARQQHADKLKKNTDKIKELEDFVRRFSANASKSKQATSRKKMIEKLQVDDLPTSTRKSPYINFKSKKPTGTLVVDVKNVSHSINGEKVLDHVKFTIEKGEKVAIVGKNTLSKTTLLQILAGEITPDEGTVTWGETVNPSYFPKDNSEMFKHGDPLFDWLNQFSESDDIQWIRGFLGRMLFSGDDATKKVNVLSGGEKARAMFSKMMIEEANTLLFDEPTDHLDLESISALNEGMIQYDSSVIFTSHDFEILTTVAERIIEVSPKGMLDRPIAFDDYMSSEKLVKLRDNLYN